MPNKDLFSTMLGEVKGSKSLHDTMLGEIIPVDKILNVSEIAEGLRTEDRSDKLHSAGLYDRPGGTSLMPQPPGKWDELGRPLDASGEAYSEGFGNKLVAPTLKAIGKVTAAVGGSLLTFPVAGIAGLAGLIPTISTDPNKLIQPGSLDSAMDIFSKVMSIPSKLITTPEEAEAVENLMLVMKPIQMAGEGWRLIGNRINAGLEELGLEPTFLEPLLATYGEASAIFALPRVIKGLRESTTFRNLTIKERALVVQSLAETMQKNPNMTEGQLIRMYDNPVWRKEALSKRNVGESYRETKDYVDAKASEAKIDELEKAQEEVNTLSDDVYREAQQKILDMQKRQAALESDRNQKSLDYGKMIKDDLSSKTTQIKKIKQAGRDIVDVQVDKAMERIKVNAKEPIPEFKSTEQAEAFGKVATSEQVTKLKRLREESLAKSKGLREKVKGETKADITKRLNASLVEATKGQLFRESLEQVPKEEPITNIDLQTGTREPIELSTENSPFREAPEKTKLMAETYEQRVKNIAKDPEMYTNKLVNDVNRWLDGEEIPIDKVRNALSELASRAEEVRDHFISMEDFPLNFENWKEVVSEAANWARKADRLSLDPILEKPILVSANRKGSEVYLSFDAAGKIPTKAELKLLAKKLGASTEVLKFETNIVSGTRGIVNYRLDISDPITNTLSTDTSMKLYNSMIGTEKPISKRSTFEEAIPLEDRWNDILGKKADRLKIEPTEKPTIDLNMMIPLDKVPGLVKDIFKGVKDIKFGKLFRNKKVFDKTGFWLGKDGKWRFELDDSKAIYKEFKTGIELSFGETTVKKLPDLLLYKELYDAVPNLKNTKVKFDKHAIGNYYLRNSNIIVFSTFSRQTLFHEVQHAVNKELGGPKGADINQVRIRGDVQTIVGRLKELVDKSRYQDTKKKVRKETERMEDLLNDKLEDQSDIDWFWDDLIPFVKKTESEGLANSMSFPIKSEARFKTLTSLGEMDSRLVEERLRMSMKERKKNPPWETLDKMLMDERIPKIFGTKLYTGLPLDEAAKQLKKLSDLFKKKKPGKPIDLSKVPVEYRKTVKLAQEYEKSFVDSEEAKKFNFKHFLNRAGFSTYHAVHEKSGLLRNKLKKDYGADGYRVVQYTDAERASDGFAGVLYNRMFDEAYKGMSSKLDPIINRINQVERLTDIFGYKTAKEYTTPQGMTPEHAAAFSELIELTKGLTPEEYIQAKKASDIIFEHHKLWIDELVKSGLKSKEEGELLKAHSYRKMKKFTVESVFDEESKISVGEKVVRQNDSGVDRLGKGSFDMLETDTKALSHELAARIAGRVKNNDMKTVWWDFVEKHPDNPFCWVSGLKDSEGVKIHAPSGWVKDHRYIDGKKSEMRWHPDVATQILTRGGEISFWLTKLLTHGLGIHATRTLAVSTSAAWAMSRGITMDVAHTFFSARSFEPDAKGVVLKPSFPFVEVREGVHKRLYSALPPVFVKQLGADMNNVAVDVFTRGPKTQAYEESGGHMPFLTQRENQMFGKGLRMPNRYEKMLDGMSWIGKSSELWNRVAVMERRLKQLAKKRGITLDEAYKNKEMIMEAVNVAAERLPYAQGGWLVKSIDKIFGPFISASYNAKRTMWRAASENPADFAARLASIGSAAVGVTLAAILLAEEADRDVPEYVHNRNVVVYPFGDFFKFQDEEGNDRWFYFKLPLDPDTAFFYNVFRGMTKKLAYEAGLTKREPNYDAIIGSLKSTYPMESPLSPSVRAWVDYTTSYSTWRDRKIQSDEDTFNWPKSTIEGRFDPRVSQLAKDVGGLTGLSPKRLEAAVPNIIPSGNEYVYIMGKLYEQAFNEVDPKERSQHWALTLSKIPFIKSFMGVTIPRAYRMAGREEIREDVEFDRYIRVNKLDALAEGFHWKGSGTEAAIDEHIDQYENDWEVESMEKKVEFIITIKDLPNRRSWSSMFGSSPEAKAKDFYDIKKVLSSSEQEGLEDELTILEESGYTSQRFYDELSRLEEE